MIPCAEKSQQLPAVGGIDKTTVDDSQAVGRVDSVGDVAHQSKLLFAVKTSLQRRQRLPAHQLHRDIGVAVHLSDFVDLADVFYRSKKRSDSATL